MALTTMDKGEIAVLKVQMRAVEKDVILSRPIREGTRYDMIADDKNNLLRVQVKYGDGKCSKSSVRVKLASNTRGNKWQEKPYEDDEVDGLLVYLPRIDKVCFFGPDVFVGRNSIYVQVEAAKNNQKKNCLRAEDYIW